MIDDHGRVETGAAHIADNDIALLKHAAKIASAHRTCDGPGLQQFDGSSLRCLNI